MSMKPVSLASATAILLTTVAPAFASGKAVECYRPYHTPPVYDTIYEQVMVKAPSHHYEYTPAIYGTEKVRVVVNPGGVSYRYVPPQYGYVKEKVIIEPGRKVARVIPAVTKTVYSKVKVSDGGYYWEWRIINGKRVLCKIKQKAHYKKVAQTVVIHPEQVVYEKLPPVYGYEKRKVLISEGYKEKVLIPAEYGYEQRQVLIEPERKRLVETAGIYETVSRQVKVADGHSGWERVAIPRHCR